MAYRGLSARLIGDVGRSGLRLIGDSEWLIGGLRFGFVPSRSGLACVFFCNLKSVPLLPGRARPVMKRAAYP